MTQPIRRILVANRAEIASRVFRTCRRLGIETVAVHSEADADLPYVREADAAVRLPGVAPADTYLRGDLLVDAARRAGADAIHPGYGFLSENAEFARTVLDAGLTWIGPPPESIDQMGSKVLAKELMEKAGVPVLTSVHVEDARPEHLPLLVKASAGGGGRGMRVVRDLADLPAEALTSSGRCSGLASSTWMLVSTGTPAFSISSLARTFEPIWSIDSGGGPIQVSPASMTVRANSAFSDRNP